MGRTLDQVLIGGAEALESLESHSPRAALVDTFSPMQGTPGDRHKTEPAGLDELVTDSLEAKRFARSSSPRRVEPGFSVPAVRCSIPAAPRTRSWSLPHRRIRFVAEDEDLHDARLFPETAMFRRSRMVRGQATQR